MSSTMAAARNGAKRLTDGETIYEVSDWSPGTGAVFGWPLMLGPPLAGHPWVADERGEYGRLPDNLRPAP